MRNLWFVSSILLILSSCSNFICKNSQTENTANQNVLSGFFDTVNVIKFKSKISYRTSEISGILVLKKINYNTLAGGLINEFGIKVFDFKISESCAKLGYVFKNLDKWYIRKKLVTDLHFLFSKPILQTRCLVNNKPVYVADINRSLHYVYYIVSGEVLERADMYKGAKKTASLQQYINSQAEVVLNMRNTDGSLSYEFCEINN
jgi:hypothetical protein